MGNSKSQVFEVGTDVVGSQKAGVDRAKREGERVIGSELQVVSRKRTGGQPRTWYASKSS